MRGWRTLDKNWLENIKDGAWTLMRFNGEWEIRQYNTYLVGGFKTKEEAAEFVAEIVRGM